MSKSILPLVFLLILASCDEFLEDEKSNNYFDKDFEIKLNINEKISLDAPKRGDVVTRYEFDEIQKIKTEEMKVRFQNNRNSGGGNFRMKNTK